jgi:hypothetical protein
MIKMLRSSNAGERSIKSMACGHVGVKKGEDTVASQKYTPVLRARGVTKGISFFFINNRV